MAINNNKTEIQVHVGREIEKNKENKEDRI